jgi:hypothetical protein
MGAFRNGVYLGRILFVHREENGTALVTIRAIGQRDFKAWVWVSECEEM